MYNQTATSRQYLRLHAMAPPLPWLLPSSEIPQALSSTLWSTSDPQDFDHPAALLSSSSATSPSSSQPSASTSTSRDVTNRFEQLPVSAPEQSPPDHIRTNPRTGDTYCSACGTYLKPPKRMQGKEDTTTTTPMNATERKRLSRTNEYKWEEEKRRNAERKRLKRKRERQEREREGAIDGAEGQLETGELAQADSLEVYPQESGRVSRQSNSRSRV